jgi:hypothetical protein
MTEVHSSLTENFSLTTGGPIYRLMDFIYPIKNQRRRLVVRAASVILISWLPLLILSLVQGRTYGSALSIPFLRDFAVNVRFLLVLPILILSESSIDHRWKLLVREFLRTGLVDQKDLPSFEDVIEKTIRLRDRVLPEMFIVAIAFFPSAFVIRTELLMNGVSNWHAVGDGSNALTLAGGWFSIVSMPIFRFLLLRWAWRMFMWSLFLWRVSRVHLYLVATHADMAAGLGFLSAGQKSFSSIVFAGGAVIAGQVGNAIAYQGQTLSSLKLPIIAYGVLAIILLVVPLLVVAPVLRKVKKKALLDYGALVTSHDQQFDTKWIRNELPSGQVILGNPDVSSLTDLASSYTLIRQMRIVPIDKPTLLSLAVAAALPILVVVLIVTPARDIIHAVLKMLA